MNRLQKLQTLVAEAASRLRRLDNENRALKLHIEKLSAETERLRSETRKTKTLEELLPRTRTRLQRLCGKIEKALKNG